MKRAFYKAIRSNLKDLEKYAEQVSDHFDDETIHELRTTYKKLRALLRWQMIDKKIYAPFKNIYHLAGEIRIIQVAMATLEKEKAVPPALRVWLSSALEGKKDQWGRLYSNKTLQRLQRRLENSDVSITVHKKFFTKRFREIHTIINAVTISDEAFHEIRKMAKDMEYVLECCKTKCEFNNLPEGISVPRLKAIGKQIGSFNDGRVLVGMLTDFADQNGNMPIGNGVGTLLDKWRAKTALQKESLIRKLRGINWVKSKRSKVKIEQPNV